jgi:hypothetical protein
MELIALDYGAGYRVVTSSGRGYVDGARNGFGFPLFAE